MDQVNNIISSICLIYVNFYLGTCSVIESFYFQIKRSGFSLHPAHRKREKIEMSDVVQWGFPAQTFTSSVKVGVG